MQNNYNSTINGIIGNILFDAGISYSCELTQQNINSGTNKFYLMQIVFDGANYHFCVRYGRVDEYGNSPVNKLFIKKEDAIKAFCKQFKAKTGNIWGSPDPFVQQRGLYLLK